MMKKIPLLFLLVACSLPFSGQSQSSFYFCTDIGLLFKYNIATCVKTSIGATGATLTDIAVTPDGKLYGVSANSLYAIDTANGHLTIRGSFGGYGFNSLVSDRNGNLLAVSTNVLCKINPVNAQVTELGSIGNYASAGDLTFYKDTLYLSATGSKLVRINLTPTVSSQLVGTMQASNIYGINTVCLNGNETMIAVGNSPTVSFYKVNTSNASSTLLCSGVLPVGQIFGAASKRDFVVPPTITQTGHVLSVPQTYLTYQWFYNNTLISGATSYSYTTTLDGDYTIVVKEGDGCSSSSATIQVVTGVREMEASELGIYPNPASGSFSFAVRSDTKKAQVDVYNTYNARVYSATFYESTAQVPQTFPPGVYFVRVVSGGKLMTTKLIVE